jgi:hypothetical protein
MRQVIGSRILSRNGPVNRREALWSRWQAQRDTAFTGEPFPHVVETKAPSPLRSAGALHNLAAPAGRHSKPTPSVCFESAVPSGFLLTVRDSIFGPLRRFFMMALLGHFH